MLPEYLEVGVKAGRGCISLPLLLCSMYCLLNDGLRMQLSLGVGIETARDVDSLLKMEDER
jgi:hypothetical protein